MKQCFKLKKRLKHKMFSKKHPVHKHQNHSGKHIQWFTSRWRSSNFLLRGNAAVNSSELFMLCTQHKQNVLRWKSELEDAVSMKVETEEATTYRWCGISTGRTAAQAAPLTGESGLRLSGWQLKNTFSFWVSESHCPVWPHGSDFGATVELASYWITRVNDPNLPGLRCLWSYTYFSRQMLSARKRTQ